MVGKPLRPSDLFRQMLGLRRVLLLKVRRPLMKIRRPLVRLSGPLVRQRRGA